MQAELSLGSISIKGFIETSFLDWRGRMCFVLFLGGCNFRCPFCHNRDLVLHHMDVPTLEAGQIFSRFRKLRGWQDSVCITGGEPCMQPDLPELLKALKDVGLFIKLDTNGSFPDMLERVISQGLVDAFAMDVKTIPCPLLYSECAGVKVDISRIRQSISIIKTSGLEHLFRMTILPVFHPPELIRMWADHLKGEGSLLAIQNFRPGVTLDPAFSGERAYSEDEFQAMVDSIEQFSGLT